MFESLQLIEILPPLLHLLPLRPPVVMLIQHPLTDIGPTTHSGLGDVLLQVMRDTPTTDRVRTNRRRTLRRVSLLRRFTILWTASVWTLRAVRAGPRPSVGVLWDRRPGRPPVLRRE